MIIDQTGFTHGRSHKESMLLLLSGVLAVAVTLIAFLRLREEHWTMAFVDAGIVCIMLLLFVFVYVSPQNPHGGNFYRARLHQRRADGHAAARRQ
jgi:heme/copper-type cytochrome/quinol oxidase subunit 4